MNLELTRRYFLGGAAAAGAATLLPSKAGGAVTDCKVVASTGTDTANASLTHAAVAKTKWKAEPFSMTEVRLLPAFGRT